MLKLMHPFGGAGSQVMKLIKSGSINQALQAYKQQPDAAGAVLLINHYSKRYFLFFNNDMLHELLTIK